MFTPKCLIERKEIENVKEDFRAAQRVEQYRIGKAAFYLPEGLRWNYIPISEIQKAEEGFRVLPGGHCNPIRAKKPTVELSTATEHYSIPIDRPESAGRILSILEVNAQNASRV